MRTRHPLLLTFVAFAIATSLIPAAAASAAAPSAMVQQVNEVRQSYGLRALDAVPRLQRGSKAHSRRLLAAGSLWHASLAQLSRQYGRAGEVLAMHPGGRAGVNRTVNAWLNSPPHRAVILSPAFQRVGAGRSTGRFGGGQATVWVLRTS